MSFVPGFAPDAKSQWLELDPVLQEMVLDELESLLANPPTPPKHEFYHDFRHEVTTSGQRRHSRACKGNVWLM
jgi:hypothetical protein